MTKDLKQETLAGSGVIDSIVLAESRPDSGSSLQLLKNPGGLELVAHFSEHEHVYRCTPSGLLNALMGAKTHVGCADGMCQISANAEEVTFVVQPWRGEIVRFIIPRLLFESALSLVGSGLKTPDSPASKARLY